MEVHSFFMAGTDPGSMRRVIVVGLLLAMTFSGCVGDTESGTDSNSTQDPGNDIPSRVAVVVADLGPGANPYHERWQRPDWTEHPSTIIPGFPEDAIALNLTFGDDFASNLEADKAVWDSIVEGQIYWIPGTNLLGYVHRPYNSVDMGHGGGPNGFHGAGTTDAINQACPDCYVLYVQDGGSMDGASVDLLADWVWVDIVTSTNTPGPVDYGSEYPYIGASPGYAKATKKLYDRGGIFVAGTGNMPINGLVNPNAPVPWYDYCCTPWVVNVGGAVSYCKGAVSLAGKVPEVTGDYVQQLTGTQTTDGLVWLPGTSFAAPQVAGRFGATLWELRNALGDHRGEGAWWVGDPGEGAYLEDGRITQEEVRAVLQLHGTHYLTTDFVVPSSVLCNIYAHPVGPVPAADLGWGYIGPDAPIDAVAALLGDAKPPERDLATQRVMAAQMEWRQAMYPED